MPLQATRNATSVAARILRVVVRRSQHVKGPALVKSLFGSTLVACNLIDGK